MSVKLFCDRCGRECKKYWELRLHTDASCLRSDFTRVLCRSCAADVLSEVNPGAGPYGTKTTGENMDRDKLIATLKMMQVETGSLVCLGCGHEHNCGVHGCAIIREAVEALAKKDAWISVQDRLPEEGYVVLAIASGCPHANIILKEAYQIAEWCHEGGWILQEFPEWEDAEVTHWMPLPEPPEEVRGNET